MNRKTVLGILALGLLAAGLALLMPDKRPPDPGRDLPWQLKLTPDGQTRVFGVALGHSTLGEAEARIGEKAKLAVSASPAGEYAAQAFYDETNLQGMHANLLFSLAAPQLELQQMFQRGQHIATTGDGARKAEPAPKDAGQLRWTTIDMVTYIPASDVDEEALHERFGAPTKRVRDPKTGAVHLLYEALGLDVAVHGQAREIFRYLPPAEFEEAMAPLLQEGEPLQ